MTSKNNCRVMDMELTGWKAKLYDIISKIERLPPGDNQRMYEELKFPIFLFTRLGKQGVI